MFGMCEKNRSGKKTANDASLMVPIYILPDLVWKHWSSFIINFEQVMKSFFYFLAPVVDCTFIQE